MRIHEAAKTVGCTQRAIKFYEEKGLLPEVTRSRNGYRDYTPEEIHRLHEIQAYRKLGISLADIKLLLNGESLDLLSSILEKKQKDAASAQQEIDALKAFIASHDAAALNEAVDYETLSAAMRTQLPGFFGAYLASHFAPYLNIHITTDAQRDAYKQILRFWDNPRLKLPLLFRLHALISSPPAEQIDAQLQSMLHPDEQTYAHLKAQTLRAVRLRENPLIRFNPLEVLKRQMMRKLKDCGYYDIFLPQMERLSPAYKAYREALAALNTRLCEDLGLYYDSAFNLVLRK